MMSYVNDEAVSQALPIVSGNHMPKVRPLTSLHTFHIRSKMPAQFLIPCNEVKRTQFGIHGNIYSRLIVLLRALILFRRIGEFGGHWHVETSHEFRPAQESRVLDEEPGCRVVRHFAGLWLAEEVAGHSHSHDTSELALGDVGDAGDIGVAHGALQRDAGQDFKVA